MNTFSCIGPDCEDNCCHGWRVDIDADSYERLKTAASFSAKPIRKKLMDLIQITDPSDDPVKKKVLEKMGSRAKRLKMKPSYAFKLDDEGICHFQTEEKLCEIHSHFGGEMLPVVCATYPRKLQRFGKHFELTAVVSCPEVSRKLLLHDDAADEEPLDLSRQSKRGLSTGMNPRKLHHYWQMLFEARGFILEVLRRRELSFDARIFVVLWFAKRTATALNRDDARGDTEAVRREIALLRNPRYVDEITKRYSAVETPSSLVMVMARAIMNPRTKSGRATFRRLARFILDSYRDLQAAFSQTESASQGLSVDAAWTEYSARRAHVIEKAGPAMDRVLTNYSINFWMQRLPSEAPNLMVHTQRLLSYLALTKFLVYSHPHLHRDAPFETSFSQRFDEVVVEVFFKAARHIEHSSLLTSLETVIEQQNLGGLGGAVYLARF